jgi:hypothetical protein
LSEGKGSSRVDVVFNLDPMEAVFLEFEQRKVAQLVPGQLNMSQLSKEQPEIIDRYTRTVTKTEFNKVAFELEEPELFEKYRAHRLVLTGETID